MRILITNGKRILFCIIAIIGIAYGCDAGDPIRIGFSGQLTGPHANMGVSGRDSALLAIDQINAAGGIAGRRVELIFRDDKGTAHGAVAADQALIDAGVVAIIGHMTSSQTLAALPLVEKAGMVLLSPTTSTPALTGRTDQFFRVMIDSALQARLLARHVFHTVGLERLAAIYDTDNAAYTDAYLRTFREEFSKSGGRLVKEIGYASSDKPVFGPMVAELRAEDPQGLLIITSAQDGSIIAQQPRLLGWHPHLFGCGWTMSASLIEDGGKSVEEMEFIHYRDANSQSPHYLNFKKRFQARYQKTSNFMAEHSYEAVLVLAAALEKTNGRADGLAQNLPGIRVEGLMESIALDQYGDIMRPFYNIVIEDGRFVTKKRVK